MSAITRRTFFQGAALAASATRVVGANDRIHVGLVGIGGRGTAHLNTYIRMSDAQVMGLCDVNQAARDRARANLERQGGAAAKEYNDMREMFASKDVDVVSIATPNHWHALATIWACEAGKDVYVEKPASYNIYESGRMVETARKYNRMVQVGSQGRSTPVRMKAVQLVKEGAIGKVYMSKGLCFKRRPSIGRAPVEPVPPGLDWDRFLGPAPMRSYSLNRFRYNWHWFWDTGNGDIGNQGIHQMDGCRWGVGDPGMPKSVFSSGGKYLYNDEQETPNTQIATFDFGNFEIVFEVRGVRTSPEGGLPVGTSDTIGNLYLGSEGWLWTDGRGFALYKGEKNEKVMEERASEDEGTKQHMENLFAACRARDYKVLNGDIGIGAASAVLVHMANISYRLGRKLTWDAAASRFANDSEADKLMTRDYRKPYVV